jgi:phosphoadenosine phosphosulfate reductase
MILDKFTGDCGREGKIMIQPVSEQNFRTRDSRIGYEAVRGRSLTVQGSGSSVPGEANPTRSSTNDGVRAPAEEELEFLASASERLEKATPEEIIAWTVDNYFPRLTMATAFGPEGCVILAMLARIQPRTYVFNLDTGYQFKETLDLRDRIAQRYGIEVDLQRPDTTVEEYEKLHGGPVYKTDSNRCCADRKIAVLKRVSRGFDAWMSGIRRDQSPHRAGAPIVGWDKKFGLVKISPLANWTKNDVWKRITSEDIPYNPLHDQGYPSIGCWPCTRAVMFGEDERAGRWSGTGKTECGLHTGD